MLKTPHLTEHVKDIADAIRSARDYANSQSTDTPDERAYKAGLIHACDFVTNQMAITIKETNPLFDKNQFMAMTGRKF